MRPIPDSVLPFWRAFAATCDTDPTPRFYEAFHFDDNEADANMLAGLVLDGTKRATAAMVAQYEDWGKPIPKPGDLSVVTDFHGTPLCVMETHVVNVVRFDEVTEAFAATEGEGDGSLRHWRRVHIDYFGRECARLGRSFSPDLRVVCEEFAVVYCAAA